MAKYVTGSLFKQLSGLASSLQLDVSSHKIVTSAAMALAERVFGRFHLSFGFVFKVALD